MTAPANPQESTEVGETNRRGIVAVLAAYNGYLGMVTWEIEQRLEGHGIDLSRKAVRDHLNALLAAGHVTRGYAPGDAITYSWTLTDEGRRHYGVTEP